MWEAVFHLVFGRRGRGQPSPSSGQTSSPPIAPAPPAPTPAPPPAAASPEPINAPSVEAQPPTDAAPPPIDAAPPEPISAPSMDAPPPLEQPVEAPLAEAPAPLNPVVETELTPVPDMSAPQIDAGARPPAFDVCTTDFVKSIFDPATRRANIEQHLPRVLNALHQAGIADGPMVLVALATIRAETAQFQPVSEGVSRYNTDEGQHPFNKYDSRADLGNRGPPDGDSYKGRGFIQLTGRDNYRNIGRLCGLGEELENNPDRANDPDIAAAILANFLKRAEPTIRDGLSRGDLRAVRRAVNGGSHGLQQFTDTFDKGRAVLLPLTS